MTEAAGRPDLKRAQLRTFHAQDLSVRAIAARLGVSRSTVSRWAKQDGLAFDRSRTAQAVAAQAIDLAAGRQRLAEKLLTRAEQALDDLDKPYLVYNFGGRDNTYNEHKLPAAPVEVKRSVVTMAAIAFDKLSRIVEKDPEVSGVESVVQSLEAGILAAANVLRSRDDETRVS